MMVNTEYRVPSSVLDGTGTEDRITVLSLTETETVPTDRQPDRDGLHTTNQSSFSFVPLLDRGIACHKTVFD